MHRGPNPDYDPRDPASPPRYGPPGALGSGSAFPGPFNRPAFPPRFPNPVSYPTSVPPPGFQSFSTEPPYQAAAPPTQFPAGWTLKDELQNLEVKKKAEEFLRILEAKDRLKLSSESGDRGTRRSSADGERHRLERHKRGRSQSRSRSRGRSRARSRGRSRSRGKSRTRAKSRPRSRSRGRSLTRSKSQPRLHKDSQRGVKDVASPSVSGRVPDLFQNLKQVLQSKELEKHLSVVKNTFMINQIQEDLRVKHETQPAPSQNLPEFPMKSCEPEQASDYNPNSVLPHERVCRSDSALPRILSWNDPGQKLEVFLNKCVFSSIEDEEEFLYGDEDGKKKPQAVTVPLAQTRPPENPISSPHLSKPPVLQEPKGQAMTSRQPLTPDVSMEECEKVKNLLKTIGLNLSQADISKMATRLKQKEQRGVSSNPALRATPDTPLNCGKVQKSDDGRSNRSESSHSHRDAEHRDKSDEREKERREKQIQKKRKEYLVKELEGLLKHEGSGDLIPVIGFFCQRCEEFFGDLSSAEGHKHASTQQDQQLKDNKRQREHKPAERRDQDERKAERKRPREDTSCRRTEDKSRVQEKKDRKEDNSQSSKNTKKKKKKEKMKKKKKVKKEKAKAEKN
ncbi:zinc finger protein 318 isoform X2 [Neoarius graeffei]|uniref:zinc finger protein 318 isoform X2 n=1 Tax=Neoarius graeffei TaxID=443677 RepID=UPI00298C11FA|nr:zinc finger protein 318 isoform X2 [Neoarius graeffei]